MNLKDAVTPITQLKNNTARMVTQAAEERQTFVITQNGRARAVLMSAETYSEWREALAMLKLIAMGEAELVAGKGVPQGKVFKDLERFIRRSARDG